ncbi:MAG: transglycosylase domain-containing protein [Anaerolineae bacterium]|nr:transglycosylase domain-containing protein [Anaerolineae bacterium]
MFRRRRWWLLGLGPLLLAAAGWGVYAWLFVDLPAPGELPHRVAAPSSKIVDRHGQLLYEVIDPHLGKHSPLPLDDIPLALQQATIATEDASFYSNPGVELRGILRSVWINLQGGDILAGGSTITQQVVRNVLLSPQERAERTLTRKLRESILAWRLARLYDKDEILALYLNEIYYGNMAYGIEAAAQAYFAKSVNELDLAECALLAGLPQAPALYNPLIDQGAAFRRQRIVLALMVKQGYISPQEAELASGEQLKFAPTPFPIRAPHFVTYVWSTLERELGVEALARGGLTVHTTLDVDLQERGEAIIRRHLEALQERGGPDRNVNNAALLALDPQTGEIVAMVGSADYFEGAISGAVNTCLSLRQPGSAIKPITYAAAFDPEWQQVPGEAVTPWGVLPFTAATMIVDVRTSFITREGVGYVPLNYDLRWHGPVLLRQALGSSYNLPAVKVLDAVGIDRMVAQARRMGITSFDQSTERFGLALTLGGGEVQLLELASAYGVLATGGDLVSPRAMRRVTDAGGQVVFAPPTDRHTGVIDERLAYLITDILADEWARLSAFGEESALYLGMPAAAKTGTTTDWRDNWTVGYTPDLVAGVWVGNADSAPMVHVSGITGAGPIWHDFMAWALKDRPGHSFSRPEGLVEVEVCALSGMLPNRYCPHRRQELFIAGTEPVGECDIHQLFRIDTATGLQAAVGSPSERVRERVYTVYPPEAQAWAIGQGFPQPPPLPEERIAQGEWESIGEARSALEIVSPFQMDRYRLSSALPLEDQRIMIKVRPGGGAAFERVTLYVDGEPLGSFAEPPYRLWWPLQPGTHEIYAVGEGVDGKEIVSEVIVVIVSG